MHIKLRLLALLKAIPYVLRALWLFFPGLLFLLLAVFVFWNLGQGKDVIRQCLELKRLAGAIALVAVVFWVFVTWYTARLVAYNHDDLYKQRIKIAGLRDICIGDILLFHAPRLIAFFIFSVLTIAFLQFDYVTPLPNSLIWAILLTEFSLYLLLHEALAQYESKAGAARAAQLVPWRNAAWVGVVATCVVLLVLWNEKQTQKTLLVTVTTVLQFGFLFLVIVRRPIAEWQLQQHPKKMSKAPNPYLDWVFGEKRFEHNERLQVYKEVERSIFRFFNILALVCLTFYLAAIFLLPFARIIGPLAFIFLAFGVLLCIGNFIGLLSKRIGTNLFFLGVVVVFIVGFWSEPHRVRQLDAVTPGQAVQRPRFHDYLRRWLFDSSRHRQIETSASYPVFFILADGGASRSGYWTVSVLGRLTDETKDSTTPFYQHLFCLSGASGGSVGNGTYVATLAHRDSLLRDSIGFRKSATDFLGSDFLTFTLGRMLGPDLAAPIGDKVFGGDRAWALEKSFEQPQDGELLASNMKAPFSQFVAPKDRAAFLFPIVVFNTTRMQDGNPGVVSNFDLDSLAFGSRIDVLDSIQPEQLRLSSAMILSARFPYISPGGRIGNSYFVDGGYFDNSGAGIVHEMLLELNHIKQTHAMPELDSLLNKLRFYVIHITNSPYSSSNIKPVHPFRNDLAAPLLTLAGSYASQTNVNNTRLENYLKELTSQPSYIEFNLYKRDSVESFPMDWVISKYSRNAMDSRVYQIRELDSVIRRLNRGDGDLFNGLDVQSAPVGDSTRPVKK